MKFAQDDLPIEFDLLRARLQREIPPQERMHRAVWAILFLALAALGMR